MTHAAYSASGIISTGAITNVQDIITIAGSTNPLSTIAVIRFKLTAIVTPSNRVIVSFMKRSSLDTGGVFVPATLVPNGSNLQPSTATSVGHYTSNPTVGAPVGVVKSSAVLFGLPNAPSDEVEWEMNQSNGLHFTLFTQSEELCVNLNGANFSQTPTIVWELHWIET